MLVFLPGASAIRRVAERLRDLPDGVDVRPLHGALPAAEQDLALAPSPPGRRRVVLSTDIAESSLTVDGVRVVVDAGEVRRPRHDVRSGLSRLHTTPASQASAEQRAGRAGRLGPGVAYRIWSAAEHAGRRAFAPPEIASADLADLALELAVWGAPVEALAFLDPPPPAALDDARTLLARLGALDDDGRPTATGRAMVDLPVHPRLARMVLDAGTFEACVLAALLEERDLLRGRPEELDADVTERVRLVLDRGRDHPRVDRDRRRTVERRSRDLARRAGVDPTPAGVDALGPTLGLAHPDRIAQARGGGRFVLRSGRAVTVGRRRPAARRPLPGRGRPGPARGGRRRRPGPPGRRPGRGRRGGAGRRRRHRGARAGVVDARRRWWSGPSTDSTPSSCEAGPGRHRRARRRPTHCVARVRDDGLDVLRWTAAARTLQARAGFARRALGGDWPDLSDEALLATLDDWLAPAAVPGVEPRGPSSGRPDQRAARPAGAPAPRAGPGRAPHGAGGQRTGGGRRLRRRPADDRRAGPGALRHDDAPQRGRWPGARSPWRSSPPPAGPSR